MAHSTAADIASPSGQAAQNDQDSQFDLTTLPQTSAESFYASIIGIILTIISVSAGWFISRKEKE
jgi:LPXTG-motif cell wall-anchored protein